MKTWDDLKVKCENSQNFKLLNEEQLKKYKKEIIVAKRFYNNGRNLYEELKEKRDSVDNRYIIPFLLELTKEILDKSFEYIQVKQGATGGKSLLPFIEI